MDKNSSSASLLSPEITNDDSTEGLINPKTPSKLKRKFSFEQQLSEPNVLKPQITSFGIEEPVNDYDLNKTAKSKKIQTKTNSKNQDNIKLLNTLEYKTHVKAPHVTSKSVRKQRRKEIALAFGKQSIGEEAFQSCSRKNTFKHRLLSWCSKTFCCCCCCKQGYTVAIDPSGRLAYWWTMVVSMAFIYNFWVLVYR